MENNCYPGKKTATASSNFPTIEANDRHRDAVNSSTISSKPKRKRRRSTHPWSRVFRSMDYDTPHCVESLFPRLSREPDCRNNLIDIRSPSRGKRSKDRNRSPSWLLARRGAREARRKLEYVRRITGKFWRWNDRPRIERVEEIVKLWKIKLRIKLRIGGREF